jgi:glycosyltransferase involved in cell wall biosynthesis
VLDREWTAPRFAGIAYQDVPRFDGNQCGREMLQIEAWCRELEADVFISTFYTSPIGTRSVMMAYDMIYEVQSTGPKGDWAEEEKSLAILHACHVAAISRNTAKDVQTFFPHLSATDLSVVHCGVDPMFCPASEEKIAAAREKLGLKKPYFLLVGTRSGFRGYKNGVFLIRTLAQMRNEADFEVVCVGGERKLEGLGKFENVAIRLLTDVKDEELVALYSGAQALVYPSRYEGFGLPIVEAMACGCPVITCANGSIPEVAGEAALFVGNDDDEALGRALLKVGEPAARADLREKGLAQARLFSWKKAADQLAEVLLKAAALPERSARESRIWQELREKDRRLGPLIELGRKVPRKLKQIRVGKRTIYFGLGRG